MRAIIEVITRVGGADAMDTTRFENVTPENFDRLKAYLQKNDCSGLDGNEGTAIGHCLKLGYRFEPAEATLDLSAESLPENLRQLPSDMRVRAGSKLLSTVMGLGGPARSIALDSTSSYPNQPSRYGVYDYVIPYVTNQSGHPFTFKDQSLTNGTLYSYEPAIAVDASVFQIFEADSAKLSGVGVGGTVEYVWADNTTVMTISFFLNTVFTHTFTVGFSTNALKVTSLTNTDPNLDGYTYLDPKITVARS